MRSPPHLRDPDPRKMRTKPRGSGGGNDGARLVRISCGQVRPAIQECRIAGPIFRMKRRRDKPEVTGCVTKCTPRNGRWRLMFEAGRRRSIRRSFLKLHRHATRSLVTRRAWTDWLDEWSHRGLQPSRSPAVVFARGHGSEICCLRAFATTLAIAARTCCGASFWM